MQAQYKNQMYKRKSFVSLSPKNIYSPIQISFNSVFFQNKNAAYLPPMTID